MISESAQQIAPISRSVEASRFRKVYGMHRYFARRPHNLFEHLVAHYTRPGDIVMDPFTGGGVSIVESLLQNRKAIGFDINPVAGYVTLMEVAAFDESAVTSRLTQVLASVQGEIDELFSTNCPECGGRAGVRWFEVSAETTCGQCGENYLISDAEKPGIGKWTCPSCQEPNRFSVSSETKDRLVLVLAECECGFSGHKVPDHDDLTLFGSIPDRLAQAENCGMWLPETQIPVCNMERESALHKKGIFKFRQLFSPRMLLAWGLLRQAIASQPDDEVNRWAWFAFSAALRYSNKMVTRNPSWRGDKPLEWAKPGYWLPPVYLEANPLTELDRRLTAITRAKLKADGQAAAGLVRGTATSVVDGDADYCVEVRSSTQLPLEDESVELVLTDPPYGSYVHYADLTNFWSVWLPPKLGEGLGAISNGPEEAVIARKRFDGAKSADEYQALLERCFTEAFRVLKPGRYMVLTFNNREPRAWISLLSAADRAGFTLPEDGVIFQDGIKAYENTAQSRRAGSVIGDFVYSFVKPAEAIAQEPTGLVPTASEVESHLIDVCRRLLADGPLQPRTLFTKLYLETQSYMAGLVHDAGRERQGELISVMNTISLFDSHRRELLLQHFEYMEKKWMLPQEPTLGQTG